MLASIGEIAAESSRVEDQMREVFAMLIDSPYGTVITAGEDLSRVCQMCARVAQYNTSLTDEDVDGLADIIRTIDLFRPHRNFFIHARWEYVPSIRQHVGTRSSRPSSRTSGADLDEYYYCTPDDALEIAASMRKIGDIIDIFAARAFPGWAPRRLPRRENWKKMENFMALFRGTAMFPDEPAHSEARSDEDA